VVRRVSGLATEAAGGILSTMLPKGRRWAWLVAAALLALACKKKQPDAATETEPADPNRCTYSTPDVKCAEGTFCFVPASQLVGRDLATEKIWGTCIKKRAIGEECQAAEDCSDPNALCDSDEPDGKTVCTLEE
jgi:hypothetical protein